MTLFRLSDDTVISLSKVIAVKKYPGEIDIFFQFNEPIKEYYRTTEERDQVFDKLIRDLRDVSAI